MQVCLCYSHVKNPTKLIEYFSFLYHFLNEENPEKLRVNGNILTFLYSIKISNKKEKTKKTVVVLELATAIVFTPFLIMKDALAK